MTIDQITTAISNYGFPMVVTAYLLVRMEKKLDVLAEAISELTHAVNSMAGERHKERPSPELKAA